MAGSKADQILTGGLRAGLLALLTHWEPQRECLLASQTLTDSLKAEMLAEQRGWETYWAQYWGSQSWKGSYSAG
jgi:hypothetical protein